MTFLMKSERWDPFDELAVLRNRMERFWSRVAADDQGALADWTPTADVIETKDAIVIKADLPGIDEKNVHVEIDGRLLTIKGERKAEQESQEKGYRRVERSYGSFLRSFTLPANIVAEKISASFTNGVLEVQVPKNESAKPRSIEIDANKQLRVA